MKKYMCLRFIQVWVIVQLAESSVLMSQPYILKSVFKH